MAILVGVWVWKSFIQTYPLGDDKKITFIGRQHYGYLIGLADSNPGTTYIYGTDLTPPELVEYFKGARVYGIDKIRRWETQKSDITLAFDGFGLYFKLDGKSEAKSYGLYTDKEYIFKLDAKEYQAAKESL